MHFSYNTGELRLTNSKQEIRKAILLSHILELNIPSTDAKAKAKEAFPAFLIFAEESKQRPFKVYFADDTTRLTFTQQLLHLNVNVNYDEEKGSGGNSWMEKNEIRFQVELVKLGIPRKTLVCVNRSKCVIRFFDSNKRFKEYHLSSLLRIVPGVDLTKLNVDLIFGPTSNTATRAIVFKEKPKMQRFLYIIYE